MSANSNEKRKFRLQFSGEIANDQEHFDVDDVKVVSGQALTCAELFRRISNGLPVGCAVRQFDQVNPYLEKMSIYDGIAQYRLRHGMLDETAVERLTPKETPPLSTEEVEKEKD